MPRATFSSPIAAVVDQARREALASSANSVRDGLGEGFVNRFFFDAQALIAALRPELLDLLNDPTIGPLLPDELKARISSHSSSNAHDVAHLIVGHLSNRHQTSLQAAVLAFLKTRSEANFCLRPVPHQSATVVRQNRPFPRPASHYPGRESEVHSSVQALLEPTRSTPSIVLAGLGGIGKTTLALMVLDEAAVKARYEVRRFWINCETAYSAQGFLESIITTLSSKSTLSTLFPLALDDIDYDFLGLLDKLGDGREPAIVAFDNLETIFDTQPELVERVLSVILIQSGVLVTMRGQRRPYIGSLWSWPPAANSWVERLPEAAWRAAFEVHAGKLSDQDHTTIRPVLCHVDGYPLALSLLGRRLIRGEYGANDLRRAWDIEIRRNETANDTRQTCISTSIRISLASPIIAETPFAVDSLILAAHLPPGFYPSLPDHEDAQLLNDLPQWFGQALCGGHTECENAWKALSRCGLAYTNLDAADRLQLLPPIRETLHSHESLARMPKSARYRLGNALETVYLHEYSGRRPPYRWFDEGDFGEAAKGSLLRDGTLASPTPHHRQNVDATTLAETASLLGLICQNAGYLVSGIALFGDAKDRHVSLGQEGAAIIATAYKRRLEGVLACRDASYEEAAAHHEEAAKLWDRAARPADVAHAMASAHEARTRIASLEGRYEDAARYGDDEALQWERSGRPKDAALALASALSCRARLAEDDGRLEDAAQCHEEEALHWDQVGEPSQAAWRRSLACRLRAANTEREDRLQRAAEYLDEEATWLEQCDWGEKESASRAREAADELRRRIAEREDCLRGVAERVDSLRRLHPSRQRSASAPAKFCQSPETQTEGESEKPRTTTLQCL